MFSPRILGLTPDSPSFGTGTMSLRSSYGPDSDGLGVWSPGRRRGVEGETNLHRSSGVGESKGVRIMSRRVSVCREDDSLGLRVTVKK